MISEEEQSTLRHNIERYEGRVNHMYLDSRGYVTVGVGNLLATIDSALGLPFETAQGERASPEDIRTEYDRVKALAPNKYAKYYKSDASLLLSDQAIDDLTNEHIESFYGELKRIYSDFDDFPSPAKLAAFDLIFNLGMTKLKNRWPNFNASVESKNWLAAADNSRRRGIAQERNDYVKSLLIEAASSTVA